MSTSQNTTNPPGDARPTYRQEWSAYNAAQVNEKGFVAELLRELCSAIETPARTAGRPRLALADTVFCAVMKVYGGASGRRTMSDLQEYAAKGYIDKAPCYNSVFNALESAELTPILRALVEESARPLRPFETDFAVDATGFSSSRSVYQPFRYQPVGIVIIRPVLPETEPPGSPLLAK